MNLFLQVLQIRELYSSGFIGSSALVPGLTMVLLIMFDEHRSDAMGMGPASVTGKRLRPRPVVLV